MIITLLINLILSNAVTLSRSKSIIYSRFVIISLISTALMAYSTLYVNPLSEGIGLYGGLFTITTFTLFFNIFIYIISGIILGLSSFFPRKLIIDKYSSIYYLFSHKLLYNKYSIANKAGEQFRIIEYALIIVFIICGGVFLISTADLISIFLSIELQSYGLYILSTIYRDSESSTTSGLTYFLLGGMSSCFILLGSALLYANSGTTSLDNIYIITSISEVFTNYKEISLYGGVYFHLAIIVLCVGLLFKVSAAPFHFWSPDVYDGIPTIVTTYVAIVAKISIFAFLMELVYYTEYIYFNFSWKVIFILSSILSLIIGSVLGLTQFRIKRLFAYSTISHVGFILLALSINTIESIQSYIFYIVQYTISNLNAFIILVTIGFSLYFNHLFKEDINISLPRLSERDKSIELIKEKSINSTNKDINVNLNKVYENKLEKSDKLIDENNSPIQLISQIKGYFYVNPFIAISLGITLFSFVGIPPLVGFFAKQMILSAALDNGYYFVTFIAILTSVIGAAYYLNLIKEIFFYKPLNTISSLKTTFISIPLKAYLVKNTLINGNDNEETVNKKVKAISFNINDIKINGFYSTVISILTLLLLLFIYMPDEWFNIANILSLILFKS